MTFARALARQAKVSDTTFPEVTFALVTKITLSTQLASSCVSLTPSMGGASTITRSNSRDAASRIAENLMLIRSAGLGVWGPAGRRYNQGWSNFLTAFRKGAT